MSKAAKAKRGTKRLGPPALTVSGKGRVVLNGKALEALGSEFVVLTYADGKVILTPLWLRGAEEVCRIWHRTKGHSGGFLYSQRFQARTGNVQRLPVVRLESGDFEVRLP